jgi:hypothetical protein
MGGTPGSVLVPILVLLPILATDFWVYSDAKAHWEQDAPVVFSAGFLEVDTPATWFVCCLVLWIVFFPLYVTLRNQLR